MQHRAQPCFYPVLRSAERRFSRSGTKTTHSAFPTAAAPSCKIEVQYNRRWQFHFAPRGESKGGGRSPLLGRWGWGFQRGRRIGTPSPWQFCAYFLSAQKVGAGLGCPSPEAAKFAPRPKGKGEMPDNRRLQFHFEPRGESKGRGRGPLLGRWGWGFQRERRIGTPRPLARLCFPSPRRERNRPSGPRRPKRKQVCFAFKRIGGLIGFPLQNKSAKIPRRGGPKGSAHRGIQIGSAHHRHNAAELFQQQRRCGVVLDAR